MSGSHDRAHGLDSTAGGTIGESIAEGRPIGSAVLVIALGWAGGVAAAGWFALPPSIATLGALATSVAAWLARPAPLRLVSVGLAAAFAGVAWTSLMAPATSPETLAAQGRQVVLSGLALDAPVARGGRFEVDIEVEAIAPVNGQPPPTPISQPRPKILLRTGNPNVGYGDQVEARGTLSAPRSRPGWPLAEILARRQIHWILDATSIRTRPGTGAGPYAAILDAHDALEKNIRRWLPEPSASLVAGMVLGARSGLPPDLRAALGVTGTTHLTAVSGLNVAIVAGGIVAATRSLLGARLALLPTLLGVWLYALLVGAPPSALRAAAMLSAALAARAFGRLPDPIVGLTLAVAALLAWDPNLSQDVGFQLSAAATAGLVLLSPSLDRRLGRLPKPLREPLAVTLAAQLATLPIILATFQTVSVVSLPANLLVAPLVLPLTWLGVALAALAAVPVVGIVVAWAAWATATALTLAVEWLAQAPAAALATGRPPLLFGACWYAMLAGWVAAGSADVRAIGLRPGLLRAGAVGASLLALLIALLPGSQSNATQVSLLDASAGTAFVRTANGRTAVLVTSDDAFGLAASVGQRLGLAERPELVLAPVGGTVVDDLLRRYPAGRVLRIGAPAAATAEPGPTLPDSTGGLAGEPEARPGTRLLLDDTTTVQIVDVRLVDDRSVLDLLVQMDDLTIWLPGPGRPSARWGDVARTDRSVLRLPTTAAAWLRDPTPDDWIAVVGQNLRTTVPPAVEPVLLDQRQLGAVEIRFTDGELILRTERCEAGRDCEVMTPTPLRHNPGTAGPVGDDRASDGRLESSDPIDDPGVP